MSRSQPLQRTSSAWELHALGRDVLRDLAGDYRAHGAQAIADLRKNEPWNYVRLVLAAMPRQVPTVDDWLDELSNEQLAALIKYLEESIAEEQLAGDRQGLTRPDSPRSARCPG